MDEAQNIIGSNNTISKTNTGIKKSIDSTRNSGAQQVSKSFGKKLQDRKSMSLNPGQPA